MGNNQSKHSDVPNFLHETSLQSVSLDSKPRMVKVRVSDLKSSTTTSGTALSQAMRDRQNKGWLLQLLEKGRPEGFRPGHAFALFSAAVVVGLGRTLAPGVIICCSKELDFGSDVRRIEACAASVMWVLEEEYKNPWKTLWLFFNSRCHEVWPDWEICLETQIGKLLTYADTKSDLLPLVEALKMRMLATRAPPFRLHCAGCGRMVEEYERFKKCRCGMVHYCSEACQRLSWPHHKHSCTAIETHKYLAHCYLHGRSI